MTLPLTPDVLVAAYEYLRTTEPFRRWKLPDSDDIVFMVTHDRERMGQVSIFKGHLTLEISAVQIGHTASLMSVMAHEMIHIHQKDVRAETSGAQHNAAFRKLAARVCAFHGFDPKGF